MKVNCQKFLFDAKVEAQKSLISKATDKSVTVPRELIKHIPDAVLQKVNAIYSIYIKTSMHQKDHKILHLVLVFSKD